MSAPEPNYLTDDYRLRSWFFTTDHKRVAILFFATITLFFFVGGAAATLIRLELATPQGDLVSSDIYNRLFTMHGVVMVWFFLIPSIPTTMGNFMLPLMLGARDLAFPRLNLTSWYLFLIGGAVSIWVAPGASGCVAAVSTQVEPTKSSLSCSILKIKLVDWSPIEFHICSKSFMPSRLYSTLGSICA